jgi:hypothetical protein
MHVTGWGLHGLHRVPPKKGRLARQCVVCPSAAAHTSPSARAFVPACGNRIPGGSSSFRPFGTFPAIAPLFGCAAQSRLRCGSKAKVAPDQIKGLRKEAHEHKAKERAMVLPK